MDFTVTLSNEDWDAIKGGWRCPALQIPGIRVENLYVDGTALDPKLYEVNQPLCLIRWASAARPRQAAAHLQVEKELSTQELTLRWKKLAIVLPLVGSLAAASITSAVKMSSTAGSDSGARTDQSRIFERSNDFLATGNIQQFPSLLKQAKREAWFVGTSFHISIDQYHDIILDRLAEGVNLHFLVLNPAGMAVKQNADLLGVTVEELTANCQATVRILLRIIQEAKGAKAPGELQVRILDEPLQSRLYMFDPRDDNGYLFYVPQINGTNSQTLPGFLVQNSATPYHATYFKSVLNLWNDPKAMKIEDWRAIHSNF